MSILIEGMEMPKDGVYWCEIDVADDIAMITIHGEGRKSFPLVPVSPHGRLGDLDALKDKWTHKDLDLFSQGWSWLRDLNQAPTVIPAEPAREEAE